MRKPLQTYPSRPLLPPPSFDEFEEDANEALGTWMDDDERLGLAALRLCFHLDLPTPEAARRLGTSENRIPHAIGCFCKLARWMLPRPYVESLPSDLVSALSCSFSPYCRPAGANNRNPLPRIPPLQPLPRHRRHGPPGPRNP